MAVHKHLGVGFMEYIYHRAFENELKRQEIKFLSEYEIKIYYKGDFIGLRRVDLFVEGVIPVEIKAATELTDVHLAQAKNYLEAANLDTGLLINFGAKSLQFKRLFKKTAL